MAKFKALLMNDVGRFYDKNNPEHLPLINHPTVGNLIEILNPNVYEIDFIAKPNKEYDVVIVTDIPHKRHQQFKVRKGNVFMLMQEPPIKFLNNYMYSINNKLNQYDQIFAPVQILKNTKLSPPYIGWFFDDYDTHQKRTLPQKTKLLSCVMSNKNFYSGHKQRLKFLTELKQVVSLDHFGTGFSAIENKGDALLPYYYSIALENYSGDYYFTEKINDCFLAYAVPLYHGCTNIDKFFPRQSYIKIDINDIPKTAALIQKELNETDYQERLPYLKEAKEIVLKKCNIGTFFKYEIAERVKANLNNPIINHTLTLRRGHWQVLLKVIDRFHKIKESLEKILT